MDNLFLTLAQATGASVDQVKLISCLLVSYPLGSVFVRIPITQPNWRHLFNVAVTSFYLLAVMRMGLAYLQLLADILATYYIAANTKGSRMPWIVFWLIMGHLTVNHIIRAIFDFGYETFEITAPQMVLTMKLTTFAWNVFDGRRPAEELDHWQMEKRVTDYPSVLAFLGYALYFPGFLVGPSLEYADYDNLVHGTTFKSLLANKDDIHKPRKLVPKGRKRVAYRKMLIGLAFLGAYVTFSGSFNLGVTVQGWFAEKSILYRIAYVQICGFFERTKYYAVWTLTEGAAILTGFGFTGFTPSGKSTWKGAANVNIYHIEFPSNFKVLLDSWNMKTNVWLRECVYKRVTPKGKKPGFKSSMITFTTSAFWHGVAGGYYLTFSFGGFIQTAQRLSRRLLRPLFLPATYISAKNAPPPPKTLIKRAYDVAGVIASFMILNYAVTPFMLLTVRDSLLAWSRLAWYGHIMVFGALAFFYGGGGKLLKKLQASRVAAAVKKRERLSEQAEIDSGAVSEAEALTLPPYDEAAKELEDTVELMRRLKEGAGN
ncbi:MBOAT-domain-containing protein [Laetiporus sulphureus 93-53]|uniref:MBOAT-domain-containing protein n=1 Tax=Laetiporus sulphureus 93-53 TaxID=1314785 RepID=A0A165ICH8_9APHY|nr:MBOAT-domain-containing protein [Laetiporus sulphureus 93-53]KZT12889.1 MBOAT-domain-containing protein [Laetiporus sulphureus 93-53]